MTSYRVHRLRSALIAIGFVFRMFATIGSSQGWGKTLASPAVTAINHPGYLTPVLTYTFIVAFIDIGLWVVACCAVFLDNRDQILGVSDHTALAFLPKLHLEMRFLGALLAGALWQPMFAKEVFALATILKLLEVLGLASILYEVHIKSLRSVIGFLLYGLGPSMAAAWASFQLFSQLPLIFGTTWADNYGIYGDYISSCLFILAISAISTFWAYWKINPFWPLVTIIALTGVAQQHLPMKSMDPHFRMESKSTAVFVTALVCISWNLCVTIGSMVMVVLLQREDRIQVQL